jgi:hypothetical protein
MKNARGIFRKDVYNEFGFAATNVFVMASRFVFVGF